MTRLEVEDVTVRFGGVTAVNPHRFEWKRARRPLFGLD